MFPTQQSVPDQSTRPVYPTYLSEWLDKLGAYDGSPGRDRDLDLARLIEESDAYYPLLYPWPNNIVLLNQDIPFGQSPSANFAPGQTQTGAIQVPPLSYLISISAIQLGVTVSEALNNPGFKLRVYEKGSQCDLFYQEFAHHMTASGMEIDQTGEGPFGPYFPSAPLIITPPGIIQLEMTNLDNQNAQTMQALFCFAVPKGTGVSMNVVRQVEN
jgi:hypothetical protein